MNHCGTCTACCKVFAIPEIKKPLGEWCQHCDIGKGCKIYEQRPPICRAFECLWLQSQKHPGAEFEPALRPDHCKVVFSATTDENIIAGTTMPGSPLAWQRKDVLAMIDRLIAGGMSVSIGSPASPVKTLLSRQGRHEIRMTPPDENGMQWSIPETKEQIT